MSVRRAYPNNVGPNCFIYKEFFVKFPFNATLRPTHKLAIIIAIGTLLWMLSGFIFSGKTKEVPSEDGFQRLQRGDVARVRTQRMTAEAQQLELTLRGRTEAKRIVDIKAEMGGRIIVTPIEKGQRIKKGQILCQLAEDAYGALLTQAKANFEKARIDYEGALKLKEKNLLSASNIAASKAALENAKANVKIAEVNVAHLSIRAPFDGFVEDRPAQVGTLIERGHTCARMIDESIMLATGQVSEREITSLSEGLPVTAQLTGGGFVKGKITFVGRTAHPQTRTYRVEATLQTDGGKLRDGNTTQVMVPLQEVMAYRISPAVLALDDTGQIGVRLVNANNIVEFHPIQVVRETTDGVWVTGLPPEINLITVGQEYVADGDKVETVPDDFGTTKKENALANHSRSQKTEVIH